MQLFAKRQERWKQAVTQSIEQDETVRPWITTIKLEREGGTSAHRGVVLHPVPSDPIPIEETRPSPIPAPRHSRFKRPAQPPLSLSIGAVEARGSEVYIPRIRTSQDISAQIAALDEEIAMLEPVSMAKP
jgi:hypothetical protein